MFRKKILHSAFCALAILSFKGSLAQQQRKFVNDLLSKPFMYMPCGTCNPITNNIHPSYRSYNGTNNNIGSSKAEYGAADIALYREMPAVYGGSDPKNAMAGSTRPSPRQISNVVIDEPVTNFNSRDLSSFVYVWGQFIDHDMSLTPTASIESVPIPLPADETVFTEPIPFTRSEVRAGTGVTNARQQTNLNTSWIDASMVYGCDASRADWLRTHINGKMKTSTGNYLPWNTITGQKADAIDPTAPSMANDADHTNKTFVAGDVRASEHPGILGLHTLFVREHNRICDVLRAQGITNDEELYQKARKQVGAIIQSITYQEFLPAIGITLSSYTGYKSTVRPDITNIFATAGYRIGHTMVADDLLMRDNNCNDVAPGVFELIDVFWTPQTIVDYGLEPFFKGFAGHTQYETDTKINSVLRNFLFVSPNDPVRFGIDLGSLNIQRGRDHGLPNYNAVRQYYTGCGASNFSKITTNVTLASQLQTLYGSINNVDLWIGILAEDRLPGKSVGNTMYRILKKQFENLRDGDYYFYKNDPFLTTAVRNQIINTKFSDVIKRNTTLTNLQTNVFFTVECPQDTVELRKAGDCAGNTSLKEGIKIYPNPSSKIVTIDLTDNAEAGTINFYSISGTLCKTINVPANESTVKVDVSGLITGVYILNITSASKTTTFRFIKNDL